jgi:hypothetical protein
MEGRALLRQIIRALPCGKSELPRFRSAAVRMARTTEPAVGKELLFHLQSQQHLRELNERYFPHSELSERERVQKVANLVGLEVPKEFDGSSSSKEC